MAYSAAGANDVSIKVKDLKSKPYIDLTLDVMKQFGMNVPKIKTIKSLSFIVGPLTTQHSRLPIYR
jgi:3-phosphoshikimate 1-carboxyvinyltransferase